DQFDVGQFNSDKILAFATIDRIGGLQLVALNDYHIVARAEIDGQLVVGNLVYEHQIIAFTSVDRGRALARRVHDDQIIAGARGDARALLGGGLEGKTHEVVAGSC